MEACDLLARYVELHNAAVDGDDDETPELFADGAEVEVEGASLSRIRRDKIVSDFKSHELMLWKIGAIGDDVAFANYAWKHNPRLGGLIRVHARDAQIRRLTLRPGYSRIFATLSDPPPKMDTSGVSAFDDPADS